MMILHLDGAPLAASAGLAEGRLAEFAAAPPPGASLQLEIGGVALEPFLRPGDAVWRWQWVAPQSAGSYPLRLRASWPDGRTEALQLAVEVLPRKLDQQHYAALLDDLQQLGRALVVALAGGAAPATLPTRVDTSTPTLAEELHSLFGPELDRLATSVERLARRPPERLRHDSDQVPLGQLRDVSRLRELRPELDLARLTATTLTHDSYENRLLRRLLDALLRRLEHLSLPATLPPSLVAQAAAARTRLRVLRAMPFLDGVPPLAGYRGPTPRIQRDPDYRVVYSIWQRLRRRPLVSWDDATLALPIADLPRLYERWCAATVALALLGLDGATVIEQRLLIDDGETQLLALPEREPLLSLANSDGTQLCLRYQARYTPHGTPLRSLDRHTRIPDLVVEIERPNAPTRLLVLDAKYRLDTSGGVPEDALADAYSYLGSIGTVDGNRASRAVALLYPGNGPAESYASGVAALPLVPGNDTALRKWLTDTTTN